MLLMECFSAADSDIY